MGEQYLAFDLGAESGRAVLGELGEDGLLKVQELHRFPNAMVPSSGHLHWDLPGLYREMLRAMGQAAQRGQKLSGIGVDTWGVDFGLFDSRGDLISAPFTYRDPRTRGAMEEFLKVLPRRGCMPSPGSSSFRSIRSSSSIP